MRKKQIKGATYANYKNAESGVDSGNDIVNPSKNDILKVIETLKKYISALRSDLMNERLIYQRESREIGLINEINYYDSIAEYLNKKAN